jgi:hypothetical protein
LDMGKLVAQWLPKPRIQHPWPNQRFAVKYPSRMLKKHSSCTG